MSATNRLIVKELRVRSEEDSTKYVDIVMRPSIQSRLTTLSLPSQLPTTSKLLAVDANGQIDSNDLNLINKIHMAPRSEIQSSNVLGLAIGNGTCMMATPLSVDFLPANAYSVLLDPYLTEPINPNAPIAPVQQPRPNPVFSVGVSAEQKNIEMAPLAGGDVKVSVGNNSRFTTELGAGGKFQLESNGVVSFSATADAPPSLARGVLVGSVDIPTLLPKPLTDYSHMTMNLNVTDDTYTETRPAYFVRTGKVVTMRLELGTIEVAANKFQPNFSGQYLLQSGNGFRLRITKLPQEFSGRVLPRFPWVYSIGNGTYADNASSSLSCEIRFGFFVVNTEPVYEMFIFGLKGSLPNNSTIDFGVINLSYITELVE